MLSTIRCSPRRGRPALDTTALSAGQLSVRDRGPVLERLLARQGVEHGREMQLRDAGRGADSAFAERRIVNTVRKKTDCQFLDTVVSRATRILPFAFTATSHQGQESASCKRDHRSKQWKTGTDPRFLIEMTPPDLRAIR